MENIKNSIPCRTDGSVHGSKDPQDSYGRSFSGWKVRTRTEHHRLHYGSRSRLCSFCAAVPGGCKEIFKTSSCSDDQRQQSAQEQSPGCKRERLNQYSAAEVIPRRNANHHRDQTVPAHWLLLLRDTSSETREIVGLYRQATKEIRGLLRKLGKRRSTMPRLSRSQRQPSKDIQTSRRVSTKELRNAGATSVLIAESILR